jgi:alpha-tubulin suppressor-like RCC1 family protein
LGAPTADLQCALLQPSGWIQDFGNNCSTIPVPVETSLRFTQIGATSEATCGLTSNGQLWCWGNGYLGDSAGVSASDTLVRVSASARFVTFAMSSTHTCAADDQGSGWCWGENGYGELGLGADVGGAGTFTPARVNSMVLLKGFGLGAEHTCAVTRSGDLLCWGQGSSGQRGDSSTVAAQFDPTFVKSDRKFKAVVAAAFSTCALEAGSGSAWCWGENSSGSLGDGTTSDRLAPAPVLGGLRFDRLSMGPDGSSTPVNCGVAAAGTYCWGLLPEPLTFGE